MPFLLYTDCEYLKTRNNRKLHFLHLFRYSESKHYFLTALVFSDFVFKIRLIRLGFPFQKQKCVYLNPQPTDSQSGVLTITPQNQL